REPRPTARQHYKAVVDVIRCEQQVRAALDVAAHRQDDEVDLVEHHVALRLDNGAVCLACDRAGLVPAWVPHRTRRDTEFGELSRGRPYEQLAAAQPAHRQAGLAVDDETDFASARMRIVSDLDRGDLDAEVVREVRPDAAVKSALNACAGRL